MARADVLLRNERVHHSVYGFGTVRNISKLGKYNMYLVAWDTGGERKCRRRELTKRDSILRCSACCELLPSKSDSQYCEPCLEELKDAKAY